MTGQNKKKKVAFVIGAGSIKCIASLGILRVLEREGIDIDLVVGCSAGSIYGTIIALGYSAQEAIDLSTKLWTREVTSKRNRKAILDVLLPKVSGYDGRFGLIDDSLIMERLREAYGDRTFADTKIPLFITATNFETSEQVVLTEGSLVDSIRGSIAIPFVFKPWPVNGDLMIDGGLADPLPIDVAIKEGADVIIAIGFETPMQRETDSIIRFAFQVTSVMTNNLLKTNFAFHNLVHHTEILAIIPEFDQYISAFDLTKVPYLLEKGEEAMQERIPYIKQLLQMES